jgi:hypothetical protein
MNLSPLTHAKGGITVRWGFWLNVGLGLLFYFSFTRLILIYGAYKLLAGVVLIPALIGATGYLHYGKNKQALEISLNAFVLYFLTADTAFSFYYEKHPDSPPICILRVIITVLALMIFYEFLGALYPRLYAPPKETVKKDD